eukprot:362179-Chlamydomonas_euryale.AAC.4
MVVLVMVVLVMVVLVMVVLVMVVLMHGPQGAVLAASAYRQSEEEGVVFSILTRAHTKRHMQLGSMPMCGWCGEAPHARECVVHELSRTRTHVGRMGLQHLRIILAARGALHV